MTIYSNHPTVRLPIADGMPPITAALIRPVQGAAPSSIRARRLGGRVFTAGLNTDGVPDEGYRQVRLIVTERGHWYRSDDERDDFHNDTVCRGCGHHGHFDYILDYVRCPKPPSGQDIAYAFLGRYATAVAA